MKKRIADEIKNFLDLLKQGIEKSEKLFSTADFWVNHRCDFPLLTKLTEKLYNCPASSANIERYFSIAGIISNTRGSNISDELVILRSLTKVNIEILKKLAQ